MKELLALHNAIAGVRAGHKTFSTKPKPLARVRALAESKGIELAGYHLPGTAGASSQASRMDVSEWLAEAAAEPTKSEKLGLGIGELARVLLMDPAGYPHALIATMVNSRIEAATATHKSVRGTRRRCGRRVLLFLLARSPFLPRWTRSSPASTRRP